jgi:hypothetical protein
VNVREDLGLADHGTRVEARRVDTGAPAPIVVERTMRWEADAREGHSSPGVPALSGLWFFAEGNRGVFDTYFLVMNPSGANAALTFTFVTEGAPSGGTRMPGNMSADRPFIRPIV